MKQKMAVHIILLWENFAGQFDNRYYVTMTTKRSYYNPRAPTSPQNLPFFKIDPPPLLDRNCFSILIPMKNVKGLFVWLNILWSIFNTFYYEVLGSQSIKHCVTLSLKLAIDCKQYRDTFYIIIKNFKGQLKSH